MKRLTTLFLLQQHILGCFGMEVLSAATPTECNPFTFLIPGT